MRKKKSSTGEKIKGHCVKCQAKCCRYFALQIDTPKTKPDFETIRWYLVHQKVTVFIDKRRWFLDVANECRFLTKAHGCSIYEKRPLICREHSTYDCERNSDNFDHEKVFRSIDEFDEYLDRRFRKGKTP